MEKKPGSIQSDYPPISDHEGRADNKREDEKLKASLEDKQPAGDAGPEDAPEEDKEEENPAY